jgi:hypothetical protein
MPSIAYLMLRSRPPGPRGVYPRAARSADPGARPEDRLRRRLEARTSPLQPSLSDPSQFPDSYPAPEGVHHHERKWWAGRWRGSWWWRGSKAITSCLVRSLEVGNATGGLRNPV